jgi:hypothetical protein
MLDSMTLPATAAEVLSTVSETQVAEIGRELDGANLTIEHLQESLADLELMLEDRGWQRLGLWADQQFSRRGLENSARLCRAMAIANPLIRRGKNLRTAYVWGSGVEVQARATGGEDGQQDVNAVVQGFLDDRDVRKVLWGAQARETNERTLGTDGNLFAALFTAPRTGSVLPRLVPLEEISDIIKNPEDRTEPWFYKRVTTGADGGQVTSYHPDVDFQPTSGRAQFRSRQSGQDALPWNIGDQTMEPGEILWDAPMLHMKVNGLGGWDFGIGDAFASIAWARAYKEFLEDWAKLIKALSRFAWRATSSKNSAAQRAADRINARTPRTDEAGGTRGVLNQSIAGQTAAMVGVDLEAIPKTGATIDSESGKPLAALIAAGMDVPLTQLLCDPGLTGARAVAETLDRPTELMAGMRRDAWGEFLDRLLGYVIDAAVRAPQGALKGKVGRDEWGRTVVTLDGETERTIEVSWPDLSETSIDVLTNAIASADSLELLPPLTVAKMLLAALHQYVVDPDEILEQITDEAGNFLPPARAVGQAAVDAFNRGEDPAAALR